MVKDKYRIGVMAPGGRLDPGVVEPVQEIARSMYGEDRVEIVFHPQCFASSGHFAGDDATRTEAFLDIANDEAFDALWFGRGGYGAIRIVEGVCDGLSPVAARKSYLGYSDTGVLLAALYGRGFAKVAHGPMPGDVRRADGEAAVRRGLAWLVERAPQALEPSVVAGEKTCAFNICILAHLVGTPFEPDLSDHVVMLEEVGEYMYRIDRDLAQITAAAGLQGVRGLKLGRCSQIPENEPDFGMTEAEVALSWCERAGIAWLGRADVGHDADNKVVPFGTL